jgi:acyl-CoA thioesterase-1
MSCCLENASCIPRLPATLAAAILPPRTLSLESIGAGFGKLILDRFSFSLIVVCFLCFLSPLRGATPQTIVFFGDSLTAGYGLDDPFTDAFPALIQKKIEDANLPFRVVNAGLSGETSAGGLRRVDWVLRQPIDIFVLALGANDGLRGIEPAVTRENLQGIIDRVRAKNPGVKIVLTGMNMPPSMGADYVRDFAAIFPELAKENKTALVPFLLEGVGGRRGLNQPDQIHPTEAGHVILAENVWKVLQPLL